MGLRDQIRSRFHVEREMGDELLVQCPHPDHNDSNPSASINVKKRLWVCYSCGKGGTVEALLGGRIIDETTEELLDEIEGFLSTTGEEQPVYPEAWLDQFDLAGVHPYWTGRGLSEDVCRLFRLGYDPESGRATYPLRSPSGAVWGVVGRAVGAQLPKYKYPGHAPVSKTLFGYHLLQGFYGDVVLCEGALDAMALWDVGITAVAVLGSRLSLEQSELLVRLSPTSLTLAFDKDDAGEKAEARIIASKKLIHIPMRIMPWHPDDAKDPLDLPPEQRREAYACSYMV